MTRLTSIIILVICSCTFAQVSTDEAMKRLQAKQAQREADRAKVVSITQGELDDMKAAMAQAQSQIKQLAAEVTQLQAQLANATAAKAEVKAQEMNVAEAIRHHQVLKGMTKDQAMEALQYPGLANRFGYFVEKNVEPGADPDTTIIRWHIYTRVINVQNGAITIHTYRKGFAEVRGGVVTRTDDAVDETQAYKFP